MKAMLLGLTLLTVLVTAGCNPFRRGDARAALCKEPEGYADAVEAPTIQIPAGLQSPDTRNALRIPDLAGPPPPPRTVEQGCLDQPPPYTVVKPAEPEA
jgi:uncharacterized lipoprotein